MQIEATIKARETRIKAKEKEIDQLAKLAKKHQHIPPAKHLEICIAFDTTGFYYSFIINHFSLFLSLIND